MDGGRFEHAAQLDRLDRLGEKGLTISVDIFRYMQADEFLAAVSVHRSGGGIRLDDALGFRILQDQSIADCFEDSPILLIFFFGLGCLISFYAHKVYLLANLVMWRSRVSP